MAWKGYSEELVGLNNLLRSLPTQIVLWKQESLQAINTLENCYIHVLVTLGSFTALNTTVAGCNICRYPCALCRTYNYVIILSSCFILLLCLTKFGGH